MEVDRKQLVNVMNLLNNKACDLENEASEYYDAAAAIERILDDQDNKSIPAKTKAKKGSRKSV